jgi:release factor glutamine methyltransferase
MPLTVGKALQTANRACLPVSETAWLDARTLLSHLLDKPHSWVLAHPEEELTVEQERRLDGYLERLAQGEPLPYILGRWEFFGLDFAITPDVLIPRPETELLVEEALAWLDAHPGRLRAADVGTGSGCIAVTLAKLRPELSVTACDISLAALRLARRNAVQHAVAGRVAWLQADLLQALAGPFDLICANLPYIPSAQLAELRVARHEPPLALDGGADGMRLIERLASQARSRLAPGGLMLLEIEATAGGEVLPCLARLFPGAPLSLLPDLAGLDRLVRLENPID